jgi:alkylation response protein AidB-like acyl-CoA dehydrogenase
MGPVIGAAVAQGVFQTAGAIHQSRQQKKQAAEDRALQLALAKFQAERENVITEASMTSNALKALTDVFNKSFLK